MRRPPSSTLFPYTTLFRSFAAMADVYDPHADLSFRNCHGDRGMPAGDHDLHALAIDRIGKGTHRLFRRGFAIDPDEFEVPFRTIDHDRQQPLLAGFLHRHHRTLLDPFASTAGSAGERSHHPNLDGLLCLGGWVSELSGIAVGEARQSHRGGKDQASAPRGYGERARGSSLIARHIHPPHSFVAAHVSEHWLFSMTDPEPRLTAQDR